MSKIRQIPVTKKEWLYIKMEPARHKQSPAHRDTIFNAMPGTLVYSEFTKLLHNLTCESQTSKKEQDKLTLNLRPWIENGGWTC